MKIDKISAEPKFTPIEFKLTIESQVELDICDTLGGYEVTSASKLKESGYFEKISESDLRAFFSKLYTIPRQCK